MHKEYLKRGKAAALAVLIAFTTAACANAASEQAAKEAAQAEKDAEKQKAGDTIEAVIGAAGLLPERGDAAKEETVYVLMDADGGINEVIVSDWLKNPQKEAVLEDYTNLTDIKNVKGDETYTEMGDGRLTWQADGADIYYQGSTNEQLPVDVKVSYRLNGEPIAPKDLAGQKGHVTIRFDYENHTKKTVTIGNEETEISVPFMLISGVMLPTDKFSNVEMEKGKVISNANYYVAVGVALPGLKDSLDLSDDKLEDLDMTTEDVDIPDYVEIEADTNDFELSMTMTMASADSLTSLGFDDLSNRKSIDKMKEDMEDLREGMDELLDGTDELHDGVEELKDGSNDLHDGAGDLTDGSAELRDGTYDLEDGVKDLKSGTEDLVDGVIELKDGTQELLDGTDELKDGARKLRDGADELSGGMSTLYAKMKEFVQGLNQYGAGADAAAEALLESYYAADITFQILNALLPMETAERYLRSDTGVAVAAAAARPLGLMLDGYEITLDAGEGRVSLQSVLVPGENAELEESDLPSPTRDGYRFTGWYADREQEERIVFPFKVTEDTTLYAGWKKVSGERTSAGEADEDEDEYQDQAAKAADIDEKAADEDTNELNAPGGSTEAEEKDGAEEETKQSEEAPEPEEESKEKPEDESKEEPEEAAAGEEGDGEDSARVQTPVRISSRITLLAASKLDSLKALDRGIGAAISQIGNSKRAIDYVYQSQGDAIDAVLTSATGLDYDYPFWMSRLEDYERGTDKKKAAAAQKFYDYEQMMEHQRKQIQDSIGNLETLQQSTPVLIQGAAALLEGIKSAFDGSDELADGTDELYDGTRELDDGAHDLDDGAQELLDGSYDLDDGAKTLWDGAKDLRDGAIDLDDGANELHDGTQDLDDGVGDLLDGADELRDGVIELDEEGIQKIYETLHDDLESFADRLEAIDDASAEYVSFAGILDSMSGSVKFIYRTDSIETDD